MVIRAFEVGISFYGLSLYCPRDAYWPKKTKRLEWSGTNEFYVFGSDKLWENLYFADWHGRMGVTPRRWVVTHNQLVTFFFNFYGHSFSIHQYGHALSFVSLFLVTVSTRNNFFFTSKVFESRFIVVLFRELAVTSSSSSSFSVDNEKAERFLTNNTCPVQTLVFESCIFIFVYIVIYLGISIYL